MSTCACGCGVALRPRQTKWASDACFSKARNAAAKAARAATLPLISKPCACGCGRTVTSRKPSRKFFTAQCAKNHWGRQPRAEREKHRAEKAARHPNTALIHEAKAETPDGECIYCPESTSSPRAFTCGSAQCKTDYQRDYAAMRRKREKEAQGRPEVACRCGCRRRFLQASRRIYFSETCRLLVKTRTRAARNAARRTGSRAHGPSITFGKATESKVIHPFPRTG